MNDRPVERRESAVAADGAPESGLDASQIRQWQAEAKALGRLAADPDQQLIALPELRLQIVRLLTKVRATRGAKAEAGLSASARTGRQALVRKLDRLIAILQVSAAQALQRHRT